MATSLGPEDEIEVLEQVEFSDDSDDDNVEYAAVQYDDDDDDDDDDEDLVQALTSLQKSKRGMPSTGGVTMTAEPRSGTEVRPAVVDDFIRNFLIKVGMERTLDCFNTEWYELQSKVRMATSAASRKGGIVQAARSDERSESQRRSCSRCFVPTLHEEQSDEALRYLTPS